MTDKHSIDKGDRDVFAKARAAIDWTAAATNATGEPWCDRLIVEDAVKPMTATGEMVLRAGSRGVVFIDDSPTPDTSEEIGSEATATEVA